MHSNLLTKIDFRIYKYVAGSNAMISISFQNISCDEFEITYA